ncbi:MULTISPECIES: DUF3828 domain-containing protein [Citrobacter]|jgi:hypothetical protein|uniref:DUF3828 domain-containing protein n=1 Tax=Citrobacter TaxID=544 RepID=UPI000B363CD5|nr:MULTISPECIES: DUF3828 domain-containing protein [Citrobacter]MBJ9270235.1 DUF3828 domain-containing protein [Citrobacter freundii]MDM3275535.1 YbjP/YqhG family protein [Citrobacter sp. Ce119]MDM3292647.1 YbjP/YqhG family protein [Citrobacter sp. Ce105]UBI15300.1 YbjP/YqhG family protein [Citrobacter europaeus]
MKRLILFTFLVSSFAMAGIIPAGTQALKFNTWYIKLVTHNIIPVADNPTALEPYVIIDTLNKLKQAYISDNLEEDYFLKVQDVADEDWSNHISIDLIITDPICTNVYLTFGTGESSQKVIDCMVEEKGVWKIKSVATRH